MGTNPNYQEIVKRIHTTPSVLFLGQSYLAEALSFADSGSDEAENETQRILDYREILSLKWSAVVSSSFDENIPDKCGDYFSFEVRSQYDKSQKIDKTVNAGYFLFGRSNAGEAPTKPDLDLDSSAKDMFSAILKKTVDSYGIVIIAGWNPETDWVTPKILYDVLKDVPEKSVFLFGAQREKVLANKFIKELTKKQLAEQDIIEDAFYTFMRQNGFFDTHLEEYDFPPDKGIEKLSLYSEKYKDGRIPYVLNIQDDTVYELKSKSIKIITDSTGANTIPKNNDTLLRFCARKGDWSYYAPQNQLVVNRKVSEDKSQDFYDCITALIGNISGKGKKTSDHLICVTGIHYSGKTALLKSFALRNKNKYPILYVEYYDDGVTEKLLSDFCANIINMPEVFSREVVVICDFKAASDFDMQKNCRKIKNALAEISGIYPVVIGTIYSNYSFSKEKIKFVPISHELTSQELQNIASVYGADSELRPASKGSSIFEIISKQYRYQYSPEAAELRAKMRDSQHATQTVAKSNVSAAYGQIYDEVYNEFIKKGILSSFNDSLDEENTSEKAIKDNIRKLNDCIALASEFGTDLPESFVFRALDWNNYRFLDALSSDCFLLPIENGFRYISAGEAGRYILFNCADEIDSAQNKEMKLKQKEADILCNIIEICNWIDYDEAAAVISLIRRFSPNSAGKDSNIIGNEDQNHDPYGRNWNYYKDFYEQIGKKVLECANGNVIAIVVASAFLRRAYQSSGSKNERRSLIDTAYDHFREILDNQTGFELLSANEKVEVFIGVCNVIISTFPDGDDLCADNFDKWDEFNEYFQCLLDLYDKSDKLDAAVILDIWHRAATKKAAKQNYEILERTIAYNADFLPDVYPEHEFLAAIQKYEYICSLYSAAFIADNYKSTNLKGWLMYRQKDSYKLESASQEIGKNEITLAERILAVFNENEETQKAVREQPLLLKTKILCDWIIHFGSLPYAEENPICFTDNAFWSELLKDINMYLALCDEKNAPAAFVKYIKCIYSLVFDDGSYRFEENVRYSKKLSPWYLKRIGVADENGQLLKFTIGTIYQRNKEIFRGKISDSDSILRNLNYVHLSQEVQKYLAEGGLRLTPINSIPDKPVHIFFNAAGATAAIPPEGRR